ncbi:MAG: AzlC family ABC transporter permease [Halanaerobiaceae bacterium]|nr:AzlC family ABC transporter permease [Halanaerobiaceae bacterium]
MERKEVVISGIKRAVPFLLGYLPIGISYGLMAVKSGLSIMETVSMSIFVFAGSSQLISVNMFAAGAGVLSIVMMTFLVNLRHILMSSSLSLQFRKTPGKMIPFLGFLVTDESFAVSNAFFDQYRERDKGLFFLSLGLTAYLGWVLSSFTGSIIGALIPLGELPGLDFVLPAMFIILLVMQIGGKRELFVALLSAFLSLLFVYLLPDNWNIIIATVLAAAAGVFFEKADRI